MVRWIRTFFLGMTFIAAFGLAVPAIPVVNTVFVPLIGVDQAFAQARKKKKRKSLFDVLFKRRKQLRERRQARRDAAAAARRNSQARQQRRITQNAPPPKTVVEKNENASKLLVVGDFMGSGVANGLKKFYADNPNIVIINKAQANSGIVRDDVVDWPAVIPELIEQEKPVAVLFLAGMNDRQQMRLQTGRVSKLSEEWLAAYNARAKAITETTKDTNIAFLWMGLPPVRSNAMNADYLVFNGIYRTKTENAAATYIDVWDGFTNAEGKFVSAGPDINGQIVRLRGSKGINMTRAGNAKLAFFADKALRKIGVIQQAGGLDFASLGTINPNSAQSLIPEYDPIGTRKTVVISLSSPASDGGLELEGAEGTLKPNEKELSVSTELVEAGTNAAPKTGRIDASWGAPVLDKTKTEENAKDDETGEPSAGLEIKELPKVTNIGQSDTSTN